MRFWLGWVCEDPGPAYSVSLCRGPVVCVCVSSLSLSPSLSLSLSVSVTVSVTVSVSVSVSVSVCLPVCLCLPFAHSPQFRCPTVPCRKLPMPHFQHTPAKAEDAPNLKREFATHCPKVGEMELLRRQCSVCTYSQIAKNG